MLDEVERAAISIVLDIIIICHHDPLVLYPCVVPAILTGKRRGFYYSRAQLVFKNGNNVVKPIAHDV